MLLKSFLSNVDIWTDLQKSNGKPWISIVDEGGAIN
jgi:hypothetical protein